MCIFKPGVPVRFMIVFVLTQVRISRFLSFDIKVFFKLRVSDSKIASLASGLEYAALAGAKDGGRGLEIECFGGRLEHQLGGGEGGRWSRMHRERSKKNEVTHRLGQTAQRTYLVDGGRTRD